MDDLYFNGQQDVVGGQKKNTTSCAIYGEFPLNFNNLQVRKKLREWVKHSKKQKNHSVNIC